jgi:NADH-quinone oxidoreductase subunit H
MLWWLLKVQLFIFVFIWLRGTLPRLRYDQFMKFGWKVLIPVALIWTIVVGAARVLRDQVALTNTELLIAGVVLILLLLVGAWVLQGRSDRRAQQRDAERVARAERQLDLSAGGHPVPPMPGQTFEYTPRRTALLTTQATMKEAEDA